MRRFRGRLVNRHKIGLCGADGLHGSDFEALKAARAGRRLQMPQRRYFILLSLVLPLYRVGGEGKSGGLALATKR